MKSLPWVTNLLEWKHKLLKKVILQCYKKSICNCRFSPLTIGSRQCSPQIVIHYKLRFSHLHLASSIQILPEPSPNSRSSTAKPPENPSWVHTTAAFIWSQESSHTVPHWLSWKTSSRPSSELVPPTNRMPGMLCLKELPLSGQGRPKCFLTD